MAKRQAGAAPAFNSTDAARMVDLGVMGTSIPPSGWMIAPQDILGTANSVLTAGRMTLHPIDIPASVSVDALCVNVGVAGVGGSYTVTAVLYGSDINGWPSCAAGPLATAAVVTSSTGSKVSTFTAITLSPGRYWVGILYVVSSAPTTAPQLSCANNNTTGLPRPTSQAPGNTIRGYYVPSLSAPLAVALTTSNVQVSGSNDIPVVGLRVA